MASQSAPASPTATVTSTDAVSDARCVSATNPGATTVPTVAKAIQRPRNRGRPTAGARISPRVFTMPDPVPPARPRTTIAGQNPPGTSSSANPAVKPTRQVRATGSGPHRSRAAPAGRNRASSSAIHTPMAKETRASGRCTTPAAHSGSSTSWLIRSTESASTDRPTTQKPAHTPAGMRGCPAGRDGVADGTLDGAAAAAAVSGARPASSRGWGRDWGRGPSGSGATGAAAVRMATHPITAATANTTKPATGPTARIRAPATNGPTSRPTRCEAP